METVPVTPHLSMLRVNGWQLYVWRDNDSVTLIDTGAPSSSAEILSATPTVDRIVLPQDRAQTVASFRRMAALDVETACFGHGEPIASGAGDRISEVAATLVP